MDLRPSCNCAHLPYHRKDQREYYFEVVEKVLPQNPGNSERQYYHLIIEQHSSAGSFVFFNAGGKVALSERA